MKFTSLKLIIFLVACLLIIFSNCINAMEFKIFYQPTLKINIVLAEGEIKSNDSQRFISAALKADRDTEGHIILALNSPGGSVMAAFELVEAMDKIGVYTIVPNNAICASACASIVFIAGTRREVVGTGLLGFHSCYIKQKDKEPVESSFCNELIAEHAISRGLAHASVNLFVEDYGARSVAWVNRRIACTMLIGMCRPTLRDRKHIASATFNASFDCNKAISDIEKIICGNPELSSLDSQMAIIYFSILEDTKKRKDVIAGQRQWLIETRNKCENYLCLKSAYKTRIVMLNRLK